ncbi:ankyrin repeat and SOCS box protein 7-like [Salvia splendens]|uniref:ankyrin repeat and SOCS box protein 7-like n=1 Tax=Salvia splendens TaxID=180675 RepID=UPI001C269001|nr:ankyrin repeat and SOCS box protein 7-like [Salvia splendens]
MASTSEIGASIIEAGASIIEAGASGNLSQLKAIRKKVGDEWEFRKICDQYSDFSTGWSVLHHAVEIGHFEMCKFLIKNVQVSVDPFTYKMDTPIAQASKGEHVQIVEFLIEHGAKISFPNVEGFTALHYALLKGNMELVELLLSNRAFVDAQCVDGTPLQIAVSRGNVEAVKSLLSHGANPDLFYAVADSPLVIAVKSRSFECLKLLLGANAHTNMYFQGLSPLSAAARDRDTKFLKSLLAAKADPNLFEGDIVKPIEEAAMVRNRAAMEILFPVTKRLAHYPDWTIDGIIKCIHSEEFKAMGAEKMRNVVTKLDIKGMYFAYDKDFKSAVIQYRKATNLRPDNTTLISKLSMCEARLGLRIYALLAARKCIGLMPEQPVLVRGEIDDAANVIIKKFLMAALAFSLDPYNKDAGHSFRVALFDYFVWLTQMSSPDEILSLS